jgi:hypothetical protein
MPKMASDFKVLKKRLCHSIVPAVAFAAHAAKDSMLCAQLSEGLVGVLNATVRMKNQDVVNPSLLDGHPESWNGGFVGFHGATE